MRLIEQLKNVWTDLKAMRNGLPANQYIMSQYQEMYEDYVRAAFSSGNHYDAGKKGRLQNDWPTSYGTPASNYHGQWKSIIARSISATDNSPLALSILNSLQNNVVGSGLHPVPRVKFKESGEPINGINNILEEGWKRYVDEWDATGKTDYYEAQKIRFAELFRTGNTITNRVKAPRGNFLPSQSQILNVLRLDDSKDLYEPQFSEPDRANTLYGINVNAYGRPISYWIQGMNKPISAENMSLHYKSTMAEQYLGIPWMTNALKYVWGVDNLFKDKILSSRIQSMITLFLPQSMSNALYKKQLNSDNQFRWESGKVWSGKSGEKPEVIQADDSIKDVLAPLTDILIRIVTASLGLSSQSVTRDLSKVNMASGRINSNEDKKSYKFLKWYFAKDVLKWDWKHFVFMMFASGKIPGQTVADYLRDPHKYNQVEWQGDGFDMIDPADESNAAINMHNNNMLSLETWYSEKGKDWRDELRQIAKEKEQLNELNLNTGETQNVDNRSARRQENND